MSRHNPIGRVRGFRSPNVGRYSVDMIPAPQRIDYRNRLRVAEFLNRLEVLGVDAEMQDRLYARAEQVAQENPYSLREALDSVFAEVTGLIAAGGPDEVIAYAA